MRVGAQDVANPVSFNDHVSGRNPSGAPVLMPDTGQGSLYNTGIFQRTVPGGSSVVFDVSSIRESFAKPFGYFFNNALLWIMPVGLTILGVVLAFRFINHLQERF